MAPSPAIPLVIDFILNGCSKLVPIFNRQMKKQVSTLFPAAVSVLCCLLFTSGCRTVPKYHYEADPKADFAAYKTFALLPLPEKVPGAELGLMLRIGGVVKSTLEGEFKSKGYAQVDVDSADFIVNVTGKVVPQVDVTDFGYMPYNTYPSAMRWGAQHPYTTGNRDVYVDEYDEGTLVVEIYDAGTKKLVWVGWTSGRMDPAGPDPDRVAEGVRGVVAAFPANVKR